VNLIFFCTDKLAIEDLHSSCYIGTLICRSKLCKHQDQFQERVILLIFPPAYVEALTVEEHKKYYRRRTASKNWMSLKKRHFDFGVYREQNEGGFVLKSLAPSFLRLINDA
jgi:hypothetical protein